MCQVGSPAPGAVLVPKEKPLYIYRTMSYCRGGGLKGSYLPRSWPDKTMQARCGIGEAAEHIKTGYKDNCGINGNWKRFNGYGGRANVLAKIWGWVYIGDKGARAEWAELVAILPAYTYGESQKALQRSVEKYGIKVIEKADFPDLMPDITTKVTKIKQDTKWLP